MSALLDALYHGQRDEAERLLLVCGADALTIHEAAAMGVTSRLQTLLDADPSLVNTFGEDGFQALALAVFFGHSEAAELLLARGADPNSRRRRNSRERSAGFRSAVGLFIAAGVRQAVNNS